MFVTGSVSWDASNERNQDLNYNRKVILYLAELK